MPVVLNDRCLSPFVSPQDLAGITPLAEACMQQLENKNGLGSDFLGWLALPARIGTAQIHALEQAAAEIRQQSQVLVVIGIGGSYLGARAAIELLSSPCRNQLSSTRPEIYFAGRDLSGQTLAEISALCAGRDFSLLVVSKSGTTVEPAFALRFFRSLLVERYGEEDSNKRIWCITDASRGALKAQADRFCWRCFVIDSDIGGRFSVLTPAGLLPMAAAGIDIQAVLEGAESAMLALREPKFAANDCIRYAALRQILARKGKNIELFACWQPAFAMMNEWLKQLFGESEGKALGGIFPASVIFPTDLHSMGQFIQQGSRNLFETVIDIRRTSFPISLPAEPENPDGLDYLAGCTTDEITAAVLRGTVLAHTDGGVPNLILSLEEMTPQEFGYLVYFFEKACAVSCYLGGVNPFDQPGVEAYKKNMQALLGKPGSEELRAKLLARL